MALFLLMASCLFPARVVFLFFYENPIEFSRKKELYDEYVNTGEF